MCLIGALKACLLPADRSGQACTRQLRHGSEIVWWDPAVLELDVEEEASLRQQRILESDQDGTAAAASEENYARWKLARDEVLAGASRPSISVQTVTSLTRCGWGRQGSGGGRGASGSRASRWAALWRARSWILAAVDLNATSEEIGTAARVHGRLVGATEPEIEAAVHTVVAALAHPLMRRAASVAASNLRRETPILLRREDGTLVEGVVDLAFREEAADFTGWTVVDFKTDREFELGRAEYTAQVALYAEAIEKATNSSVSGILLVI